MTRVLVPIPVDRDYDGRRLRVSRSELYAKAIAEYLKQQQDDSITERLNLVYSRRPAKLDSGLHRAQLKSLEKDSW